MLRVYRPSYCDDLVTCRTPNIARPILKSKTRASGEMNLKAHNYDAIKVSLYPRYAMEEYNFPQITISQKLTRVYIVHHCRLTITLICDFSFKKF